MLRSPGARHDGVVLVRAILFLVITVFAAGCTGGAAEGEAPLRFAVVPAGDTDKMVADFQKIADAVGAEVGREAEVVQATDYGAVIEDLARGGVDVAWFGPASYYFAQSEAGAEAFAVGESSDGVTSYHSVCVVPADSKIKTLDDLKGRTVAMVDPASTSGSIVPTGIILSKYDMLPNAFFGQIVYAGSHDAAFERMLQKQVDAAFMQDITLNERIAEGTLKEPDIRIIEKSDPIPGSPLCLRGDLDEALKTKLKAAFLSVHEKGVAAKVQGQGDFARFIPTDDQPYLAIFRAIEAQKLKREELLK